MYTHASLSASEHQQSLKNAKVVDRAQANAPGVRPISHQATIEKTIQKAVGPSQLWARAAPQVLPTLKNIIQSW